MIRRKLEICNKLGLHARAAARFVQLASAYDSHITLARDAREVNGKSIMGVMMLAAGKGVEIELIADGKDEREAADALEELVRDRFGEDE